MFPKSMLPWSKDKAVFYHNIIATKQYNCEIHCFTNKQIYALNGLLKQHDLHLLNKNKIRKYKKK